MRFVSFFLFTIYLLSMTYPDLERYIFNNEIMSSFGVLVFLALVLSKKYKRLPNLRFFFLFIFYGFLLLLFSVPDIIKTGPYLSLRTMVLWYSSFAFFAGIYTVSCTRDLDVIRAVRLLKRFSWVLLFVSAFRLTPQVVFSIGRAPGIRSFLFFLLMMLLFYSVKPGLTTVTGIIVGTGAYFWSNSKVISAIISRELVITVILCSVAGLYFLLPLFEEFMAVGYEGFGSDNNAIWRLMFWLYLFKEQFLNSPFFGIGFGTKLFDLLSAPGFITADDGSRFTEYTLGTHNSFVYALIRMGAVGFFLLIVALVRIFSFSTRVYKFAFNKRWKSVVFSLILANLMFLNSTISNVILESPLYAANFWFTLGIMYAVCLRISKRVEA